MNRETTSLAALKKVPQDLPTAAFERFAPALYQYAFRLHRSSAVADQVVGEIFTRFLEQLSLRRYSAISLRLDLYTIAYDILVRDTRYSHCYVPGESKVSKSADTAWLDTEDRQLLRKVQHALLYYLTDDQRHVVLLRFVEGFSVKETALITGKKIGTVKVIQNRGIAALRKAIDYEAVEMQMITRFIHQLSFA